MATQTTNLQLVKPAADDQVDIAVINGNMDKIDAFCGVTSGTPTLMDGIKSADSMNKWYKTGRLVTVKLFLQSSNTSDVNVTNGTVIASGLPAPVAAYNYMAVTFSGTVENRKHYRVRLMPTGNLIAYWDTVVIPAPGAGLVIDMTYISAA